MIIVFSLSIPKTQFISNIQIDLSFELGVILQLISHLSCKSRDCKLDFLFQICKFDIESKTTTTCGPSHVITQYYKVLACAC